MYHLTAAAQTAHAVTPEQMRAAGVVLAAVAVIMLLGKLWNALFGNGR
jgi:hypothetical protein